jgi:hypothetical protein
MRPLLRFHSNRNILYSHTRDIQVFVYPQKIQYDIPLQFEDERKLFGATKYFIRLELDTVQPIQLLYPKENPVLVEYKNLILK